MGDANGNLAVGLYAFTPLFKSSHQIYSSLDIYDV